MSTIAGTNLAELAYEWCTEFEWCIDTEVPVAPPDVAGTEDDTQSVLFTGSAPTKPLCRT